MTKFIDTPNKALFLDRDGIININHIKKPLGITERL
jgi:histidinol phosphatase-like enzyme